MKTDVLFKKTSKWISAVILLAGMVVIVGWIFDIPLFKSVANQYVTMKANAAVGFILTGLFLLLPKQGPTGRLAAQIAASGVLLIGLLTTCEYLFRWDLGIDQLLFRESASAVLTLSPGRMALNTSMNFSLIGVVLLLERFKEEFFSYLKQSLLVIVGSVALLSFVGYLYGASLLYLGSNFNTAMAVHTSVLFILSSLACLLSWPEEGFMRDITSEHYGGLILRRILPVAVVAPLLLGWIRIQLVEAHLIDDRFGIAFVVLGNLFVITFSVYLFSVFLNQIDSARAKADEEVKRNEALLAKHVEKLNVALKEAEKAREIMVSMLEDNNQTRAQLEAKLKELKETQYMLLHTEKLASLGELVSSIAHEVNNPLMIISGNAQLCQMEEIKNSVFAENIQNIVEQCQRAKEILQRMLTFSRPAKGDFTEVDIYEPLDFSVKLLEHQYALAKITMLKDYAPGLPKVWIDEKQIHEVFVNLLKNAAESMTGGGNISLRTFTQGNNVMVAIEDTGCGIPQGAMNSLFVPFYTTKKNGTGLGLPVCYGIIKAHGGSISFDSKVGKGTIVTVSLPIKR